MTEVSGLYGRLFLDGEFTEGWVAWTRGRILSVRRGTPSRGARGDFASLGRRRLLPGFVDTLVHGYGGYDASEAGPEDLDAMARALARAGVTSALAGLYPLPLPQLRERARVWRELAGRRRPTPRCSLRGWHLEGPFLEPSMRGALPADGLRKPSAAAARTLLRACGGWLRLSTLAPELRGAHAAAAELLAGRAIPSIGHCAASYEDCAALPRSGRLAITHLGNRMPPLLARAPGPMGFALAGGARWVGAIPDGVHLAPPTLSLFAQAERLGPRLMLQSDNLSHAGGDARDFRAGGRRLHRDGPAARDARGSLSGTLDALPEMVFARVREGTLGLPEAVRGACEVPGRLLGRRGRIHPGCRADFVEVDARLRVVRVWVGGREVPASD